MILLAIAAWTPVIMPSADLEQTSAVPAHGAPVVFFGLRTYTPTMYDGMERYSCENPACRSITEVDTEYGVGKLSDGRFIALSGSGAPTNLVSVGSLREVTRGRMTEWSTANATPTNIPQITNYRLSVARPIFSPGTYVGLWQSTGARGSRKTLVVLFGNMRSDASNASQDCGPYRVLASVSQPVEILEVRAIYHIGNAVNLASYDNEARAVWIARMIINERDLACR